MLYLNFLYAPNGGGYQNSISLLNALIDLNFDFSSRHLFIYKDTGIHEVCTREKIPHTAVKKGVFNKLSFEISASQTLNHKDIVFSIFGPPMLFTEQKTLNIGGMAISNVLHPEIDFWEHLSAHQKLARKSKDLYRISRYKKLDAWIFETDLLKTKAVTQFGFPELRCHVVKMAPSLIVSKEHVDPEKLEKFNTTIHGPNRFLFLCGAHPNKRLHLLPKIAKKIKETGIEFRFVLTADANAYLAAIWKEIVEAKLEDCFINIGPVRAEDVATIVGVCDVVCTFSKLESFSNNFVEAWALHKPLAVTDADWARHSCKEAAAYVDPESPESCAHVLLKLAQDKAMREALVAQGRTLLQELPNGKEKAIKYLSIVDRTMEIGKITKREANGISL